MAPDTLRVDLKIDAPVTPNPPVISVLPATIKLLAKYAKPVTLNVDDNVAAPETPKVDLKVTAPVTPKPPVTSKFPPVPTLVVK